MNAEDRPIANMDRIFNGGMIHGQGVKEQTEQGAIREANKGRGRFDLLPYEACEAYAIWSELGADKYGDRNWEKGLSVKDCINRLVRHALKAGSGWTDEDHLAACMWNAAAAITMIQRRPDCNDHPWTNHRESNVYYIHPLRQTDEPGDICHPINHDFVGDDFVDSHYQDFDLHEIVLMDSPDIEGKIIEILSGGVETYYLLESSKNGRRYTKKANQLKRRAKL